MFEAFHISVSMIWACNWLTESIRSFSSIEAMLTLSLILTFCTQVFNYKILSVFLKFCLLEIIDCCKSAFSSFQFFLVVFCKILRYCNSFFCFTLWIWKQVFPSFVGCYTNVFLSTSLWEECKICSLWPNFS